ncbi:MAG: PRC-barrel domain-containing protein [Phycisphaerales bacterium JB065]
MNTRTLVTTVVPIAAIMLAAGTTLGQTGHTDPKHDQPTPTAQNPAMERGAMFALAADIRGREIYNRENEQIGTLTELIIDTRTGTVQYAVVSFGGWLGIDSESVAVPMGAFAWDRSEQRFLLPTTRAKVEAAPKFNSENWDQLYDRSWRERTRQAFGSLPGVEKQDLPRESPERKDRTHDRFILSKDLADATLFANKSEELGGIGDLIIDRNSGAIGFVTLEKGGVLGIGAETYILPWEALSRTTNNEFAVQINKDSIDNAPKIDPAEIADLSSREVTSEIYAFYKVQPRQEMDIWNRSNTSTTLYASAHSLLGSDVVDRSGEQLGEISDMVVHFRSGTALYAVVSYGGVAGIGSESVTVPLNMLSWDRAEDRFELDITRDRLHSAPKFDPENMSLYDDETWKAKIRTSFGKVPQVDPSHNSKGDDRSGTPTGNRNLPGYMLVSDIRGTPLTGKAGEEIGSVNDVIVDHKTGHLGFLTMETGGVLGIGADTVVVPWEVVRRVQEDNLRVNLTTTRLEQAPRIQTDRIGDLNNREYAASIYEYYQVEPRRADKDRGTDQDHDRRDPKPGSTR